MQHHQAGRLQQARIQYLKALALQPDNAEILQLLGVLRRQQGYSLEAVELITKALVIEPNNAHAYSNLGMALAALGRFDEAIIAYRHALAIKPDYPEILNNLGNALRNSGSPDAAIACFRRAIAIKPDYPEAHNGLGAALHLIDRPAEAAASYREALRLRCPGSAASRKSSLAAIGCRHSICTARYLAAEPARAADWRKRLAGLDGLRVGLVWAGGQRLDWPELAATDRRRSMTLDTMAPLRDVSGVSFVSLQKGEPAAQTANPPRGMVLHDFTAELNDFADTAALVDCLNLVISVDTAVVHLAGALGKPVWLLNRFDTCWRWLLNRDDSPWSPQLRQFRQPNAGNWHSAILQARDALKLLVAGDRGQQRPD